MIKRLTTNTWFMRQRLGRLTLVVFFGAAAGTTGGPLVGGTPAWASPAFVADQWGLGVIGAAQAWQYASGAGVKIGIVDTGIDTSQVDLAGKVAPGDATTIMSSGGCESDPNGADDNGHGTHVSGIAAADGAQGVIGVAPAAQLVVAKVLDCNGSGNASDVAAGIEWVVQHGARVVNLSIGSLAILGVSTGGAVQGSALGDALDYAWSNGAIPVVAAGNNGSSVGSLVGQGNANFSGVPAVIVAATGSPSDGKQDELAFYSSSIDQAEWGIAAPGGDDPNTPTPACVNPGQGVDPNPQEILSTYWTAQNPTTCYATDEGTSMATPFVTGTLALLLSRGLSPSQAVQDVLSSADHSVSCGADCAGLLSAGAALSATGTPGPGTTNHATPSQRGRSSVTGAAQAAGAGSIPVTAPTTKAPPASSTTSTAVGVRRLVAAGQVPKSPAHGGHPWWILGVIAGLGIAVGAAFLGRQRTLAHRFPDEPPRADDPFA
ncbi:MAG: S8 family serine peptidase [Acidimicrobiales bacterium]